MIRKRTLFILIAFVLLLSNIPALAADVNEIDYKDYVRIVRENYRAKYGEIFDTPTPIFKAVINGETYTVMPFYKPFKAGEEQIIDATIYQDSRAMEPHITIPVGAEITFEDISIGGNGRNIRLRDWQVYLRDKDYNEYDRIVSSGKSIPNIKAEKEGYIVAFLNVADDLKYESYNNWSDKGNWRESRKAEFDYKGKKVVGWYFTVIKIKIEESVDFEIEVKQSEIEIEKDKQDSTNIDFTVTLRGTDEEVSTVVNLYKDNILIDRRNVTIRGNETLDVSFTVPTGILQDGENTFYGVVNSDYDLSTAKPYKNETYLENNKAEVVVTLKSEKPRESELPSLPDPPNPVVTETRSPNVAIKWDKIPLKINETSTLTAKLQRNSSSVTWNRYQIEVVQDFQGTIRGTKKIKEINYGQDFMLKRASTWYDLNLGGKPKYTVPSNGKPGTMLIAKLTVWSRLTDPFPGLPPAPQKPQPEVPKPSYPPPSPPYPPPDDAPDSEWSAYFAELSEYHRLMEPWYEYYAYINSPEYQEYLLRLADYGKLSSVRSQYNTLEDRNPELIPVAGYNFAEYAAYHANYNNFVSNHIKRYVAIEDTPKSLYWFRRQEVSSKAEAKNTIVHIPVDPNEGGLDPGILIPSN